MNEEIEEGERDGEYFMRLIGGRRGRDKEGGKERN